MNIVCFARDENTVKYHPKRRVPLQSSQSIFESRAWFTHLEALLPRLFSRLGCKYVPQLLRWKATHCHYN